jgi:prophage regulatory protein
MSTLPQLRTFEDPVTTNPAAPLSADQQSPVKPATASVLPIVVSADQVATAQEFLAGVALQPLLVSAEQAASLAGVDRATWYRWHSAGLVPAPAKIGGTVRWSFAELSAWAAAGCPPREAWERMRRK